MCPQGACTRGCKVTLVAFVCRTICSAAIPAKNWNSSCSSAAILFPVRQIHEDNLRWQQRQLSHNMFSGGACTRGCKDNPTSLQNNSIHLVWWELVQYFLRDTIMVWDGAPDWSYSYFILFHFSVACSKTQNIQYQRGIKGLIEPTPTKPNKMTYFGDK